jgi:hypothetical protein
MDKIERCAGCSWEHGYVLNKTRIVRDGCDAERLFGNVGSHLVCRDFRPAPRRAIVASAAGAFLNVLIRKLN